MTDYLEPLLEEEDALTDEGDASALTAAGFSVPAPRREGDGEAAQVPSQAPAPDGGGVPLQGRLNAAEGTILSAPSLKRAGTGELSIPAPALLQQTLRAERTAQRAETVLRPSAGTGGAARREEFPAAASVPPDPKLLDAAVRRDSRRYDNGFVLY